MSDSETPWMVAPQAPLSMGFSRQECWTVLPFPSPGDLPNPGIEPMSPALAGGFFTHWAIVASSDQKHWHHLRGFWKYGLAGCTQIFWVRSCSTNRIPRWQVSTLALTSTDALRPGRVCVFTLLTTLWVWADHITYISPRIFTCKMWERAVTKLNIAAWSLAWWCAREESVNVSSVLPWLLCYGLTMYL